MTRIVENTRKKGGCMPLFITNLINKNGVQSVELPKEAHFYRATSKVWVKIRGQELVIAPLKNTWDSKNRYCLFFKPPSNSKHLNLTQDNLFIRDTP
jgi:virulence-associated protein VagC